MNNYTIQQRELLKRIADAKLVALREAHIRMIKELVASAINS